uniref:ATP synthase complex subunit 8 n=1 Tax=Branchiostoma lanceolatum TaxID=7740 RepID=Q588E9_BRALA|nr:ATP synthetase subunit 8 [Branchiostoma lanceolatum]BAH86201.1 ATP synthase F0 subunit 8 [Branchiostoma lanceolatum]BAH86214.1 ATP synthase F0 subunit 8 [Branchiostoma lanceolatum]BAH86227.1 ATP synthase F0 subunit 8 [Branchiostoma lanceolatum]BAH86240.1 ATP synthase F0 subunit 8 [Branchiostoma lanceolatum]
MPQLNPIPWVFLFALVWVVLIFWGLHKFTSTISPILEEGAEELVTNSVEYTWPW